MNEIEYKPTKIKKYELAIWESGNCKSLAEINFIDGNLIWDYSGCINIKDYVKINRNDGINEGLCKYLSATRKIVEGIKLAEEYVISSNDISLDPDKVWINTKTQTVKLLPGHESGGLIERICELITMLGSEDLAKKIEMQNHESAWSYKELLRFLSSYELELR